MTAKRSVIGFPCQESRLDPGEYTAEFGMPSLADCTVVFDLDGTLVDSAPDIHIALNKVMATEGLPPAAFEDARRFIGQGARALIVRALAVHGVHPEGRKLDALTEAYIATYAEDLCSRSQIYPRLVEALDALATAGAGLSVCTNKRTDLSVRLIETLGLARHFRAVIGADAVRNRKPHPDHFVAAVRAASGNPGRALMVGDSSNDVNSAKAANAPVAVYAHGYTDTAPELLGADAVFTHYDELPALAYRLLGPQPTPRT
jgi:phosphoglycolate phosphatase